MHAWITARSPPLSMYFTPDTSSVMSPGSRARRSRTSWRLPAEGTSSEPVTRSARGPSSSIPNGSSATTASGRRRLLPGSGLLPGWGLLRLLDAGLQGLHEIHHLRRLGGLDDLDLLAGHLLLHHVEQRLAI